jgi:hypothetical protein
MTTFRFSSEPPDRQFIADLKLLNTFNETQTATFIDIIINFMLQQNSPQAPTAAQFSDQLSKFVQQNSLSLPTVKACVRALFNFLRGCLQRSLNSVHVREDLVQMGLTGSVVNYLPAQWALHYSTLSATLIGSTFLVQRLLDMEWRFGVTMSNNEMRQVGTTFLQLKLVLDKGQGVTQDVYLELTLPQFYHFLREMEKAKNQLEFLS